MTLSMTWRGLAATTTALLLALLAPLAHAQSAASASGTYMVEGGSYMIELRQDGDTLVVVEPNKESPYARQADGSYTFYNPNTETNYGIRILDANTIEAFKPDHPESEPTRLVRMGGSVASGDAAPVASADTDRYEAMAEHYQQLAQDDPGNVQAWTACSAVALKRSVSNPSEADAYATQMAGMLKQMDVATSPCPDAMPGW
jgi:hypothetical protein